MEKDAICQIKELCYPSLQHRIKTALDGLIFAADGLFQFWAAEEIEGQHHLTTTLQPFAITKFSNLANEKLREYRKHCVGYKLLVQDEDSAGILARVFRNQLPEFVPVLKHYSEIEYPQRDLALSCGIESTVAYPIFYETSGQPCVGVLELLFHGFYLPTVSFCRSVLISLEKQHLMTIDMELFQSQIDVHYGRYIQDEIRIAVKEVLDTYDLPFVVTWVSSKRIFPNWSYNKPQLTFQGELLVASLEMSSLPVGPLTRPWRVNQGLVGKVFSSGNIHFYKDVCQLSISEYPHLHLARELGIAASFAVCLRNISTGNHEFVIEFSLSREVTYHLDIQGLDIQVYFSSILATMKQHLRSFEVITGVFTEFPTQSDNDFAYQTISASTTSEGDSMQSLGTTECSMNSTCRQPVWPSQKRVNESNLFIPESSYPVNRSAQRAESESNGWVNVYGYRMSANRLDTPKLNQSKRAESLHSGSPKDVELMKVKVSDEKEIIAFDLPLSSSYANLRENIVTRWRFCFPKEKAFAIKYLNDFYALISLATDKDLQECMARTRSRGENLIRMLIQMEDDVQGIP